MYKAVFFLGLFVLFYSLIFLISGDMGFFGFIFLISGDLGFLGLSHEIGLGPVVCGLLGFKGLRLSI